MNAAVADGLLSLRHCSVGNGGEPDSHSRLKQLYANSMTHIAGTHNANADRVSFSFSLLQNCVNYHLSLRCIVLSLLRSRATSDRPPKSSLAGAAIQFERRGRRTEFLAPPRERRRPLSNTRFLYVPPKPDSRERNPRECRAYCGYLSRALAPAIAYKSGRRVAGPRRHRKLHHWCTARSWLRNAERLGSEARVCPRFCPYDIR